MAAQFTLLINSCDAYRDCWDPVLRLLLRYWPEVRNLPIVLNTEHTEWQPDYLHLRCAKVALQKPRTCGRLTWSQCLLGALKQIQTPYVIYFQDDYFLDGLASKEMIDEGVDILDKDADVASIALTNFVPDQNLQKYRAPPFFEMPPFTRYRVNAQAAIWRKQALISLLDWRENPWQFEFFGSMRSSIGRYKFLRRQAGTAPALSYDHLGGVVKGRWTPAALNHFAREGITFASSRSVLQGKTQNFSNTFDVIKKVFGNPHGAAQLFRLGLYRLLW